MNESKSRYLDKITSSVYRIFVILQNGESLDHEGKGLQFLHWNQKMDESQRRARLLMDTTVAQITKINPMISEHLIYDKLVYRTIGNALWYPKDVENIQEFIRQSVKELLEYEAYREIDIPVIYLDPGEKPLKFGLVAFHRLRDEDKQERWWESIKGLVGNNVDFEVVSYARLTSLGDHQKSLDNADKIVNEMLTFLRAVGYPITTNPQLQFGVVNDYAHSKVRPYRIGNPTENYKLEGTINLSWKTGPGIAPYNIRKDFLSKISPSTMEALQELIENDYLHSTSAIKAKFILGLHWLGEATKPDVLDARFVKLSFSLEGFIGGGISDSRETKKSLAKRAAIIAGKDSKEQKQIYDFVQNCYKKRSNIVHGKKEEISQTDFMKFGELIRSVAWALLGKIDEFEGIDDLEEWCTEQQFFLPTKVHKSSRSICKAIGNFFSRFRNT